MRKVILYIAMSIDGYIADKAGGVSWLGGQDEEDKGMGSYDSFIATVDTVILGYKTYHQIAKELFPDGWIYSGMKSYVLTHRALDSTDEIIFTDKSLSDLIKTIKSQEGKNIWICGGSTIVNQLFSLDLIDRYHITVIPTILGGGIRLFDNHEEIKKLKLMETNSYNGMVDLVYESRK